MRSRIAIICSLIVLAVLSMTPQRRITPVKPAVAAGEPQPAERDTTRRQLPPSVIHFHDDNGNVILIDTITGAEYNDTTHLIANVPKMEYPLLSGVSIGVDIWDPLMRAFGNHYGLIGFSAGVNLHNRYRPVVDVGIGDANFKPDGGNFTYKSNMAPYFKIGADYNFLYNSSPAYEVYAGVRVGFTPFKYEITDITLNDPYWGETSHFDIPSQSVTASYFELLIGVKVKLWGQLSAGWQVKYHSLISDGKATHGQPWYIPGYGTHRSNWAGSFSFYYTFNLNHPPHNQVNNESQGVNHHLNTPLSSEPLNPEAK